MSLVAERTAAIRDALAEVKAHCMCANFHDDGRHYVVYYPLGMRLDGARANYTSGKAVALSRLLSAMERHWQEEQL